jgi:hypothetical protein
MDELGITGITFFLPNQEKPNRFRRQLFLLVETRHGKVKLDPDLEGNAYGNFLR